MNKSITTKELIPPEAIKDISEIEKKTNSGIEIMNVLQGLGIKEATFTNGAYYRHKGHERVLSSQGIMIAETETDVSIRFPKEDISPDELINAKEFKPTQKMIGAYVGKSQSTVSNKRNK